MRNDRNMPNTTLVIKLSEDLIETYSVNAENGSVINAKVSERSFLSLQAQVTSPLAYPTTSIAHTAMNITLSPTC
jgi:hypothetical protein